MRLINARTKSIQRSPSTALHNILTLSLSSNLLSGVIFYCILLFQILGSTAEDYFSPSLEQFSKQLSLPPRFSGVTLLALGNGAADVSATISSILSPPNGYLLSLGALTGAGMFVSTICCSIVILYGEGVNCKGALIRDICTLCVTIVIVGVVGWNGEIGGGQVRRNSERSDEL